MSNANEPVVNKLKAEISAKIGNGSKTNDDSDTLLIVKCLGGIDDILLHYIEHNIMVELSVQKNEEIYHILTRKTVIDHHNLNIENNKHNKTGEIYYTFDENNTYLQSLFSPTNVHRISNFIYNRYVIVAVMLMHINVMFLYISGYSRSLWHVVEFATACIETPYYILLLLSINRTAFKVLLQSFDFWIKLVNMIIWALALSLYWFHFDSHYKLIDDYIDNYSVNLIIRNFCWCWAILFITFVALFDGFNTNIKFKIALTFVIGISYILISIQLQFLSFSASGGSTIHIYGDIVTFTCESTMLRSSRVMGIFFLKQSYLTYHDADRCTTIQAHPVIKWISVDVQQKNNGNKSPQQPSQHVDINTNQINVDDLKSSQNRHDISDEESSSKPINIEQGSADESSDDVSDTADTS
eukprot:180144_1